MLSFAFTWLTMAGFWFLLSGFTDPIHLGYGAVSATLVSVLSHRHLTQGGSLREGSVRLVRTAVFLPWLLWQIVLANVDVILCVLGVREIQPRMIRTRPATRSTFGLVALANSITLTPGTVTVDVEGDVLLIHALTSGAAKGIEDRVIEQRVLALESTSAPPSMSAIQDAAS